MKRIRKLLIALGGLALSVGAVVGVGLNSNKSFNKAEAATASSDSPLLITCYNNATNAFSGCGIAVEYYNATSSYTVAADVIGSQIRSVTLPKGTTGFNLYRMKPEKMQYLPYAGAPSSGDYYNNWNYSYDSSKNMVVFTKSDLTNERQNSDRTLVPKGTTYIYNNTGSFIADWFADGRKAYLVTFSNDYYGTSKQFIEMERIGNTQYMSVTTSITLCLDNYYYVRATAEGDSNVTNQTTDITINRKGGLVCALSTGTDGKVNWKGTTEDSDYAELWGAKFESNITCSNSGSITSTNEAWDGVKADYNALTTAQQGIVYDAVGSISGTTYLSRAIYRYDYIVLYKKAKDASTYSYYDDFINRKTSGNRTTFGSVVYPDAVNSSTNNNMALISVLTSSAIALLAVGGYFFIRRKADR